MNAELKVRTDRWLPAISRLSAAAASTALLVSATACGANPRPTSVAGPDGAVTTQVLPQSALYILEISGLAPSDTSLAFKAGEPRTVILRHGAPAFGVFATLVFPAGVFSATGAPDSVHIRIKPRPGIYGVDFECDAPVGRGATLTFKYPVHFLAPAGAVQRYGGLAGMERALLIGRQTSNGDYALLASTRPAPDNLQAPLSGPGTYVVAAPR